MCVEAALLGMDGLSIDGVSALSPEQLAAVVGMLPASLGGSVHGAALVGKLEHSDSGVRETAVKKLGQLMNPDY